MEGRGTLLKRKEECMKTKGECGEEENEFVKGRNEYVERKGNCVGGRKTLLRESKNSVEKRKEEG